MGLVSWYNNRIRKNLAFEGVPQEVAQRHFDVYLKHGYSSEFSRFIENETPFLENNPRKRVDYQLYIMGQIERRFEEKLSRLFVLIADALT